MVAELPYDSDYAHRALLTSTCMQEGKGNQLRLGVLPKWSRMSVCTRAVI